LKINDETVKYVSKLARLNLTESQIAMLTRQMEDILMYVDKLEELETKNVSPTAHVLPLKNVFREDEVLNSFDREEILKNAPLSRDGCFVVPQVFE
jgi:aspartyl-tRNA(Asn)/glutamyl-tRNA(Gln) amidotransferase subunit C